MENKNKGFINSLSVVTLVCGTMGKRKTTMITDMALSQSAIFTDEASKKILEQDLKFPKFPWKNLENSIKKAIKKHAIYNLATCKRFVDSKAKNFQLAPRKSNIFMYDFYNNPMTYNDNLKIQNIWEVIQTYTELYYLYVHDSNLILGNYSIRTDAIKIDKGNMPLYDNDFFNRNADIIDYISKHAHILDFDTLRLGRKVNEETPYKDALDFGVICITEIGNERQNSKELQETKKNSDDVNQKNDLFNTNLKMIRHSATIDYYPFIKIFSDEQRPESWGADARDLANVINIKDNSEQYLTLPFFFIEELLHDLVFSKFKELYNSYRFNRGDNTLLMYLIKKIASKFHSYYTRIYNNYGYICMQIEIEQGTLKGDAVEKIYYLANKKIYSKRYQTDAFKDIYTEKTIKSEFGLADLQTYKTEHATLEEMTKQNSFFVRDIVKNFIEDSDDDYY